jgi:hypothetical protein
MNVYVATKKMLSISIHRIMAMQHLFKIFRYYSDSKHREKCLHAKRVETVIEIEKKEI